MAGFDLIGSGFKILLFCFKSLIFSSMEFGNALQLFAFTSDFGYFEKDLLLLFALLAFQEADQLLALVDGKLSLHST